MSFSFEATFADPVQAGPVRGGNVDTFLKSLCWAFVFSLCFFAVDTYNESKAAEIMVQLIASGASVTQAYCVAYQPHVLLDCIHDNTIKAEKLMAPDGEPQPTYNPD